MGLSIVLVFKPFWRSFEHQLTVFQLYTSFELFLSNWALYCKINVCRPTHRWDFWGYPPLAWYILFWPMWNGQFQNSEIATHLLVLLSEKHTVQQEQQQEFYILIAVKLSVVMRASKGALASLKTSHWPPSLFWSWARLWQRLGSQRPVYLREDHPWLTWFYNRHLVQTSHYQISYWRITCHLQWNNYDFLLLANQLLSSTFQFSFNT